MTNRKDLLSLGFYKKMPYKGSDGNMRYMIEMDAPEDGPKMLKVTIWPGPYCYEATDQELMTTHSEEFSEDGMNLIIEYLNKEAEHFNS